MSQNRVTTTYLMQQELVGRKQPALNPKASPDIVAEKKEIESLTFHGKS